MVNSKTHLVRLAAVLTFALGTSACSTLDSAYDDVMGSSPPATTAEANGFPADTPPAGTVDPNAAPALANVPPPPSASTTPDDQRALADSLAADRARANYSADALRGGTEAAAPPPAPPGSEPEVAALETPAPAAPPPADTTAPAAPPPDAAPPPPAPTTNVASAAMPPPPGTMPAVPANGGIPGAMPAMASNGQLGFKPSTAPALDPSISQFVPQPIILRYQETAGAAGVATGPIAPSNQAAAVMPRAPRGRAMGGPEAMTGSVVANLDAINNTTPSVYSNANGTPAAVVMFPGDGIALSAAGRAQVRQAVAAFQARGGGGFIKVVGHSSSRTPNMPVEKHLVAIFAKSQQRAQAVAREIIAEGVPASRVLVEAVGDSQPVYYESMPQGEDGNRRAEIFIQG